MTVLSIVETNIFIFICTLLLNYFVIITPSQHIMFSLSHLTESTGCLMGLHFNELQWIFIFVSTLKELNQNLKIKLKLA
jgi:hypothetical protein